MKPQSDSVRDQILASGRTLVAARGFSGMGLAELLKTARIPKGSFYHYFASKEDFGCKLLEQYLDQYVTRLDELLGGDRPDARAALMQYWSLWIGTQTSGDARTQCLIVKVGAEVSDISDEMRRILQVGTDTITGRIVQAIADGLDDGSIARTVDPDALGPALYQMWLGASLMAKLSRKPDPLLQAMTATELMLPRAPL